MHRKSFVDYGPFHFILEMMNQGHTLSPLISFNLPFHNSASAHRLLQPFLIPCALICIAGLYIVHWCCISLQLLTLRSYHGVHQHIKASGGSISSSSIRVTISTAIGCPSNHHPWHKSRNSFRPPLTRLRWHSISSSSYRYSVARPWGRAAAPHGRGQAWARGSGGGSPAPRGGGAEHLM